jgi:hypothetical protein
VFGNRSVKIVKLTVDDRLKLINRPDSITSKDVTLMAAMLHNIHTDFAYRFIYTDKTF